MHVRPSAFLYEINDQSIHFVDSEDFLKVILGLWGPGILLNGYFVMHSLPAKAVDICLCNARDSLALEVVM